MSGRAMRINETPEEYKTEREQSWIETKEKMNPSEKKEKSEKESISIKKVFDFLKSREINYNQKFYEFKISGEIQPDDIKLFIQLPYEIALTEENGKIILSVIGGTKEDFNEQTKAKAGKIPSPKSLPLFAYSPKFFGRQALYF